MGKEAWLPGEIRIPDTFMDNSILILIGRLEAHGGHFRVPAACWAVPMSNFRHFPVPRSPSAQSYREQDHQAPLYIHKWEVLR